MDYRIGQTLVDHKRSPTSSFMVLRIRDKTYPDGNTAIRVKGVLVTGYDGEGTHLREMDSRSLQQMFPHRIFDPEYNPEDLYPENK